jgi:hypothetical protein
MAAEQCVPLSSKRVVVIPTRSVPQGVSALLAVDEADSIEDIRDCMVSAAGRVHTAMITLAARDSKYEGYDIKEGEYLALIDGKLNTSGAELAAIIDEVVSALNVFSPEFVTVFYGEDVNEGGAAAVVECVSSIMGGAEISVINGGQPIYHYIISAE